jgi:ACS family glucarate transporter-like MFS transporter
MNSERPTRIRWLLVAWVALMGAVSYLDRVNISIAGHSISQEFHLSDTQLGWIFSAFSLGYALFQIGGGWVADRLGPRRVLAFGATWWAVFTTLTTCVPAGFVQALLLFWSVRFLLGVGESVMYPSSNRWVAHWIPTAERGLANGLIFAGVGAGAAFTPPIITAIMLHFGWRAAFWVCAVLGLLVGLGWYGLARDHPNQHAWVNEAERKWIREGIPQRDHAEGPRLSWSTMLASRDVWAITLSYFCYGYVAYIFFSWFFIYLTTVRGLNLKAGSYYSMLPFLAMSLGSAAGGWIADAVSRRFGRWWGRCGVAALGLAGAAVFVAVGAQVESAAAASVILAGGAGSLYLAQSAYWALSADLGGRSSGSLSGFVNMGAQLGSAVTAVLTPVLAHNFGWTASFLTAACLCALGSAAWLVVNPNRSLVRQDSQPSA